MIAVSVLSAYFYLNLSLPCIQQPFFLFVRVYASIPYIITGRNTVLYTIILRFQGISQFSKLFLSDYISFPYVSFYLFSHLAIFVYNCNTKILNLSTLSKIQSPRIIVPLNQNFLNEIIYFVWLHLLWALLPSSLFKSRQCLRENFDAFYLKTISFAYARHWVGIT